MKRQLLALTIALSAVLPATSRAEAEVSFQFFYDNLSPHGEWIEVGDYGNCWRPNNIDEDWSPYTDGYWSYTDAGWTWVSYEDFGDITYHYGRWVRADEVGWCWVPDYEWGPAWVSWRSDDDYVGWAPLPPEARWNSSVGFSVWVDDYCDIGPSYYNFCPVVEFGAPVIRNVCVPRVNIVSIFARSVNVTNICFNRDYDVPFCGGPSFAFISGRCRRPVPTLKIVKNTTIINNNYTVINNRRVLKAPRNTVAGNTLNVFAPRVVKNTNNIIQPRVTKVVAKDKVRRGWDIVKDQGEVKQLRDKVKNQSKGLNPDTAPAKPVQIADLKPLPAKADPTAPSPVARPNGPRRDRDKDGVPDRIDKDIAGRPDRPGNERPDRPNANPGVVPGAGQPNGGRPDRPGIADRPNRGGKGNKGDKPDGQPDAPVAGVTPERPDVPQPSEIDRPGRAGKGQRPDVDGTPGRVTGEPNRPETLDRPNRKGPDGIRKPFNENRPENPVAVDQPPVRPSTEAPVREPGEGRGKGKKANNDAQDAIERQQRQQQIAEQQAQRDQAERLQRQNTARTEQRDNAERLERQQAAREQAARQQQAENQARREQMQAQRERQDAAESQRQQQRALESQRQQQMQRQLDMQQQRQQQNRQQQQMPRAERPQPQPQRQQMPPQRVQQAPQRQNPNAGGGGNGGGKGGGGRQLSPEEAQALRRAQRGF